MSRPVVSILASIALLLPARPADAQPASAQLLARPAAVQPTVAQLLARPVSPATLAALVSQVGDVAAQATIVEALKHPRADVRAMAARVTFVARAKLAISSVPRALEAETDDGAAAEMTRVVATFEGPERVELLVAAAKARGAATRGALLESFARSHPALLLALADEADFDDAALVPALVVAAAQHASERAAVARAAIARGPAAWSAYLRQMHEQMVAVDPGVMKEALASTDARVRTAAACHVAVLAGHVHGVDRTVLAAAADGAETTTDTTWERAYREIARRAAKRAARPVDWAALLGPDDAEARRRRFAEINATLLGADREAVQALTGPLPGAEFYVGSAGRDHPESRYQKTRTVDASLAAVLPELRTIFACKAPDKRAFAAATMLYGPDGRPRLVRPGDAGLDDRCARVAHTVFLLTIAPSMEPVLPQTSDGLYLPFMPEYLACVDAPPEPVQEATPAPGRVLPRPRSRLAPDYPKALKGLKIAGTVKVEAEVTSRGCVRAAETRNSLDAILDVETLNTVLGAGFEPMTVDGRPVASRVALAVTFRP